MLNQSSTTVPGLYDSQIIHHKKLVPITDLNNGVIVDASSPDYLSTALAWGEDRLQQEEFSIRMSVHGEAGLLGALMAWLTLLI